MGSYYTQKGRFSVANLCEQKEILQTVTIAIGKLSFGMLI